MKDKELIGTPLTDFPGWYRSAQGGRSRVGEEFGQWRYRVTIYPDGTTTIFHFNCGGQIACATITHEDIRNWWIQEQIRQYENKK